MARILIVEGDVAMRSMLQMVLRRGGHVGVVAHDVTSALSVCDPQSFDVVIADLLLPAIGDLRVLCSSGDGGPAPKIIGISGGDQTSALGRAVLTALFGAVVTIEKPFTHEALTMAIGQSLRAM